MQSIVVTDQNIHDQDIHSIHKWLVNELYIGLKSTIALMQLFYNLHDLLRLFVEIDF